jgi:nucleoside recognition membrane protein YjiH
MGIIQGREEGVAVRGMYPTQQGPAFIRPFMRFLTRLLLLVGLVMLVSSHFFPFFPSFWAGESFARRVGAPLGDYRRPCRSGDFP